MRQTHPPHLTHAGCTCSAGGAASTKQGGPAAAILDLGILLLFATPLAGILLLFATPLAGILAAAAGFALERDWVFTGTTTLLLVMLAIAFIVALH